MPVSQVDQLQELLAAASSIARKVDLHHHVRPFTWHQAFQELRDEIDAAYQSALCDELARSTERAA